MEYLNHGHYFPMPSQGNINSISYLHLVNDTYKILVASLKRQVFYLEYLEKSRGTLTLSKKEVSFTYIPASAEIITIDAFNKSEDKNDFVIGITIIKKDSNNGFDTYLNIYSEYQDNSEFNIDSIAENCLNVQLNFIPHYHGHTELIEWDGDVLHNRETVFLLTGSDCHFHAFREDTISHTYQEIIVESFFPEFYQSPSIVTWIEVHYYNDYSERLTIFGTETGYIRLCKVCTKTRTILMNHSTHFISYVSHIKIYVENEDVPKPSSLKVFTSMNGRNKSKIVNIIVVNTSLASVFFRDCLNHGLDKYNSLRRCDLDSVSSCVEVADLDFDGHDEILVGNSIQQILLYKINKEQEWRIQDVKNVVSPIFRLKYLDLTSDGVKELLVFTMKGIYIFQHDAEYLQTKLEEKVDKMTIPPIKSLKM